MNQNERLDYLIEQFKEDSGQYRDLEVPADTAVKKRVLRSLMNIRMPKMMAPFANQILIYDITGQELAEQLSSALKKPNLGDQMSGLTFTYTVVGDGDTTQKNKEYEILSITLDDGTEVDLKDNKTLYRVCTVDYCASVPGSVFQDKKPVVPVADAPVDVDLYIDVLRKEREENDGYIYVDTGERGIEVAPEDAAGELKKTA